MVNVGRVTAIKLIFYIFFVISKFFVIQPLTTTVLRIQSKVIYIFLMIISKSNSNVSSLKPIGYRILEIYTGSFVTLTCSVLTIETLEQEIYSLLLTLNMSHTCSSVSIANFKHVTAGWEKEICNTVFKALKELIESNKPSNNQL